MGKWVKPDWEREGPEGTMVVTCAIAFHADDERILRAVVSKLTGAHTVTVTSATKPADGIIYGSWAYRSHGAWRHDIANVLKTNFIIVDDPSKVTEGHVYLAAQGERKPAE